MLITLANILIYVYQHYFLPTKPDDAPKRMTYLKLLMETLPKSTVVMRSMRCNRMKSSSILASSPSEISNEDLLMSFSQKQILKVTPKLNVDLNGWTSFISQSDIKKSQEKHHFILFETHRPENEEDFLEQSFSIPSSRRVKVADCVTPIAWHSGVPFGIVAECTSNCLKQLAIAFIEDTLVFDDMLELNQIVSVDLVGQPTPLYQDDPASEDLSMKVDRPGTLPLQGIASPKISMRNKNIISEETSSGPVDQLELESQDMSGDSYAGESLAIMDMDDLNEGTTCVFEGIENTLGLDLLKDDDCLRESEMLKDGAGEAMSPSILELAPELAPLDKPPIFRKHDGSSGKPPNLLIYCGKKDSARLFASVKKTIKQCINSDRYVIYNLKHEQVHTTPWADNAAALILASEKAYDGTDKAFLDYYNNGGQILSFGCIFDTLMVSKNKFPQSPAVIKFNYSKWKDIPAIVSTFRYDISEPISKEFNLEVLATEPVNETPLIVEAVHKARHSVAILSQIHLEKDPIAMAISPEIFSTLKTANEARINILKQLLSRLGLDTNVSSKDNADLTPAVLWAYNEQLKSAILSAINTRAVNGLYKCRVLTLAILSHLDDQPNSNQDESKLQLLISDPPKDALYDMKYYKEHLKTEVLGKTVIYGDVMMSTMNVIDSLMLMSPPECGLIAIARNQKGGKGRGGNTWLSPKGCVTFSFHYRLSLQSTLGQHLGYVQHIVALAVVKAVSSQPGYDNINLRVKWPNDLYHGTKVKIGGILVQSSVMQNTIHFNIGVGINLDNEYPTVCINKLAEQYSIQHDLALDPLTEECVIVQTLNHFEKLVKLLEHQGYEQFAAEYYKYWLHSEQKIHLGSLTGPQATIQGLDHQGYLQVKTTDGKIQSVQPDGNSFDILQNLVFMKS